MMTIEYRGVFFHLTEETYYDVFEDIIVTESQKEWLRTHDKSDENYSDIFKDVYGIRPRW